MPNSLKSFFAKCVLTALVCALIGIVPAQADWLDDVGYSLLEDAFGGSPPNGAGVLISQVEAPTIGDGNYLPDATHPQFQADTDPLMEAVTFVDGSPAVNKPDQSPHATTTVGIAFYGNTSSLAGGANHVTAYEANNFLTSFLRATGGTPGTPTYQIQNHSWQGSLGSTNTDRSALRRLDAMVDDHELITAVGLANNGNEGLEIDPSASLSHPSLFAHSYNAIAVGATNGYHSRGVTSSLYGPGRSKPDIVAPRPVVSSATAAVSSAATTLYEVADGTDATRSEVMKAILLAGATKDEFANYVDPATDLPNVWERTTMQPLDDLFGAGELNIYNSYLMLLDGQTPGSDTTPTPASRYGWDYQSSITPGQDVEYEFEIPTGSTAKELSIILAWNVDVNAGFSSQTLANLDLELVDSTGTMVDESVSAVDNVEHNLSDGPCRRHLYIEGLGRCFFARFRHRLADSNVVRHTVSRF